MAAVTAGEQPADGRDPTVIALFDVDGTLTQARKKVDPEMLEFLRELRKKMYIGMVGGSDLVKQKEQLGDDVVDMFDYVFAENGLRAYKNGALLAERSMRDELGEDNLKAFINYTLKYLADVEIPVKRGTFIEFRTGMLNVSPVGRNCSQEERDAFEAYDAEHHVRRDMVKALEGEFAEKLGLKFSVGGQISFDVFPVGWDKTYCLQFVQKDGFQTIHFFGDKTYEGGNDHEIFASEQTLGHTVVGPEDTLKQCKEIFGL